MIQEKSVTILTYVTILDCYSITLRGAPIGTSHLASSRMPASGNSHVISHSLYSSLPTPLWSPQDRYRSARQILKLMNSENN